MTLISNIASETASCRSLFVASACILLHQTLELIILFVIIHTSCLLCSIQSRSVFAEEATRNTSCALEWNKTKEPQLQIELSAALSLLVRVPSWSLLTI